MHQIGKGLCEDEVECSVVLGRGNKNIQKPFNLKRYKIHGGK